MDTEMIARGIASGIVILIGAVAFIGIITCIFYPDAGDEDNE